MAISSRRAQRSTLNIWPGFVDALSQLIMVIVFVLLIFTAGQFYLTDALSGRDAALQQLTAQLNQLTDILALERRNSAGLQVKITQLTGELATATQQRDALNAQVAAMTAQLAQNGQDVAAARERSKTLEAELAASAEHAAEAQKESDAALQKSASTVSDLNLQIDTLKQELERIAAALDASEAANKAQQVQLADLGKRLNQALASKVEELARYRSEFFGRLREILGDRPDIRVVGDRFVFQSEVLFDPGSAALTPDAKTRLAPVAQALKAIAGKIPDDIPWILRVDGHTDKRPINTPEFPSNWELSTARALSVVRYLVDQGIPANRLAAAGFGEYQPVDPGDSEDAYRRNRRIELKLTER